MRCTFPCFSISVLMNLAFLLQPLFLKRKTTKNLIRLDVLSKKMDTSFLAKWEASEGPSTIYIQKREACILYIVYCRSEEHPYRRTPIYSRFEKSPYDCTPLQFHGHNNTAFRTAKQSQPAEENCLPGQFYRGFSVKREIY